MSLRRIKYIIGYVDSYDHITYKIVYNGDVMDSHNQIWPNKVAAHGKFRWTPELPNALNTYNEGISDDLCFKIWDVIDKNNKRNF